MTPLTDEQLKQIRAKRQNGFIIDGTWEADILLARIASLEREIGDSMDRAAVHYGDVISALEREKESISKLIKGYFPGPHDSLEDLVRNLLQAYCSSKNNEQTLEQENARLRAELDELKGKDHGVTLNYLQADAERVALRAELRKMREALEKAHRIIDLEAESDDVGLCRHCSADDWDGAVGVFHDDDCILTIIQQALAAKEHK